MGIIYGLIILVAFTILLWNIENKISSNKLRIGLKILLIGTWLIIVIVNYLYEALLILYSNRRALLNIVPREIVPRNIIFSPYHHAYYLIVTITINNFTQPTQHSPRLLFPHSIYSSHSQHQLYTDYDSEPIQY